MKKLCLHIAFTFLLSGISIALQGQCLQNYSFTAFPAPNNGTYNSGETVTFCFETDWDFSFSNPEFLMGIEIILGSGWDQNSLSEGFVANNCTTFPENTISCNGTGSWSFVNGYTNPETLNTMGPGFLFEDANPDPTNYWGDNCGLLNGTCVSTCFNFCFNVTVADYANCSNGADLSVSINPLSDANAEIGNNSGGTNCAGDPNPSISATANCCDVSAGSDNCVTYCSDSGIGILNLNDMIIGENTGGDWFFNGVNIGTNFFNPANDPGGTYTYVITGSNGCTDESNLEITINPFPDAGPPIFDLEACSDFPVLNIISFFTPQPVDLNGSWEDPDGNPWSGMYDADVDPNGTYLYITATNGICPGDTVFVNLTSVDYGNPGVGISIPICSGADPLDLFNSLQGNPDATGTWTDPNNMTLPGGHLGTLDPSTAVPGIYTYTIANGTLGQCSSSAEVDVTITASANAGVNSSTTICSSAASINLLGFLNGGPDAGGVWTEQATGNIVSSGAVNPFDYPVNTPIDFVYTIGSGSCEDSAILTVTFNVSPQAGMTSGGEDSLFFCGPSVVDFNFIFTNGTGPYNIIVTDQDGNNVINENGISANSFNTSLLVNSTSTFTFSSFDDTGNTCLGFINTDNTLDVIINSPPNGSLSLSGDICLGDSVVLDLTLSGNAPFTVKINIGGTEETFVNLGMNESIPVYPGSTGLTNIELIEVIDGSSPACTTATSSGGSIDVFSPPELNIFGMDSICPGEQAQLEVGISGMWADYSIWLSANNTTFEFSNVVNGDIIDVPASSTISFCADSIAPTSFNQCVSAAIDCVEIYVSDNPAIDNPMVSCDPFTEEGIITFDIIDGDSDDFTISGIDGTVTGNSFESNIFPNGDAFSIVVEDEFGCSSSTENININCSCTSSFSGSMVNTDTVVTCNNLSIDVLGFFLNDSVLEPGDIFEFVLHDSPDGTLGNVFATNTLPVFFYSSILNFGQVYYISPIAGLDDSGNVNLLDPCLSVGPGIPIIFNEQPTANIVNPNIVVCSGQAADIEINLTGEGPWTLDLHDSNGPVAGSPFVVNSSPFVYSTSVADTYTISNLFNINCSGSSTAVQATVSLSDVPTVTVLPLDVFCENAQNELFLNFTGQGPWTLNMEYNGSPQPSLVFGNANSSLNLVTEGTFVLTGISDAFCSNAINDTIEIVFFENPMASISGGGSFCEGDSSLIELQFSGGNPDYNFEYTDGTQNFGPFSSSNDSYSFYASNGGNYQIISLSDNFCDGTFSGAATIEELPNPEIDIVLSDNEICEGENITVSFNFNSNDSFQFDFIIQNDTNTLTVGNGHEINLQPDESSSFQVINIINQANGCSSDVGETEFLDLLPTPQADAGPDVFICSGDTAQLGTSGNSDAIYFWENTAGLSNPQSANPTVSLINSSNEEVSVEYVLFVNENGCFNSDTTLVNIYKPPVVDFYHNPDPVLLTDPTVNLINLSDNDLSFIWDVESIGQINEVSPTVTFSNVSPDFYTVCLLGTDPNACAVEFCRIIEVSGEPLVYIANAFTPDGDGINDHFLPVISNGLPQDYELQIFNRWGEQIFFSEDPTIGWDGSGFNEEYYAQTEVYVWTLRFKNPFSAEILHFQGHVTLIR